MDGWQTIADATALLAGAMLLAILTWSARARGAAHRLGGCAPSRGGESGVPGRRGAHRRWRLT